MAEKMLIDASHSEETRVVVVRGSRIEEFDFESEHKKQIRGNIYLAKVTRVEPSLQAAFVDYGGNRHGFLAFDEIHPDYYQIPLADRQALLRAEAEEARRERDDDVEPVETAPMPRRHAPAPAIEPATATEAASAADADVADAPEEVVAAHETVVAEEAAASDEPAVEAAQAAEPELAVEEAPKAKPKRARRSRAKTPVVVDAPEETPDAATQANADAPEEQPEPVAGDASADETPDDETPPGGAMAAMVDTDSISEDVGGGRRRDEDEDDDDVIEEKEVIESVGAEDAMEEVPERQVRHKPRKQYRIQEVIKRRQILLVQVAKEERGNKGAALTTYLSLAGRYSVLMPNTARGGGISRKITNLPDRKRLKEIARELEVPQGMGVILRTAGANRTKVEIKRDFEYLMRLWENVRTLTLASTAPCLVYEEGSLIKRSIRDLYNKDISEIIVSGEEGYKEAKGFMKMLMPSHAKVVQPYRDVHPIFARSGIEAQLDKMLQPQVTLKSGGYIIINQTEALVAIDVNSGRSTREYSIEDTALQTNLEAAEEVARQLRLRDLAGLIVIDFIDMEEKRNNRSVEKRLKDHLKNDRARIQVGRISHFGLLEMSRQRIRASVLESTTQTCPHCTGTGLLRSQSSVALHVLRGIEEYLLKNTTNDITVRTTPDIALYVLNHKRSTVIDYESRFGVAITIDADAHVGALHFAIDKGEPVENPVKIDQILHFAPEIEEDDTVIEDEIDERESDVEDIADDSGDTDTAKAAGDDQANRKRKRRRRRRGGSTPGQNGEVLDLSNAGGQGGDANDDEDGEDEADTVASGESAESAESSEQKRKRRRRGKRGGRRNRPDGTEGDITAEGSGDEVEAGGETGESDEAEVVSTQSANVTADDEPVLEDEAVDAGAAVSAEDDRDARNVVEAAAADEMPGGEATDDAVASLNEESPAPAPAAAPATSSEPVVRSTSVRPDDGAADAEKPKKGGWWQKRGFF